jgi:hypothetical protein
MKKFTVSFLLVIMGISSGMVFQSCENELDLVAPYKEIGIIYGLLNPTDTVHYIRIQKAFLGEGNALVMAQNPDSVYYPDILDAKLQRVKNGSVIEDITLTRFTGPPLDAGTFPSTPNILYKTNGEKVYRDSDYRIVVVNTQTGYEMTAETPIIDSLNISRPKISSTQPIPWASQFPVKVEYTTGKDGKVFSLTIRFWYDEEDIQSGVTTRKYADWHFPNYIVKDSEVPEVVTLQIDGSDFFRFVGDALQSDPDVRRFVVTTSTDFIINAGAKFLADYININSATTSILTTIPQYTNVTNGTGIFSSRYTEVSPNKPLTTLSHDELINGQYTSDLGFE